MKKLLALLLTLTVLLSFAGCTETRTDVKDYQYMYDVVHDWNKGATPGAERENLFGYGEYLYNSYLLLFPRETPSTLQEFYFYWEELIDVDGYAAYFTCKLSQENYQKFAAELGNFEIKTAGKTLKPLRDDTHFSLPAYILQWMSPGGKWEVLEYILLDEENCTAVFVYTMGCIQKIEENSNYQITPNTMALLDENFSIYDDFENAQYDISFLSYLA